MAALLLAVVFCGHAAPGVAHTASVTDCDSVAFARVLEPSGDARVDARAYWLDASTLQWPGKPSNARYVLLQRASSSAPVRVGERRVRAIGVALPLHAATTLAPALATRFKFIGAGARLALSGRDAATLRASIDAPWLLVQLDAQGRVVDSTRVQLPGLLDAAFAPAATAPLGVIATNNATQLVLWAPTARRVAACLYASPVASASTTVALQRDSRSGVWSAHLPGDHRGGYYLYLVDVFVPGVGLVRNRVTDPYSISLTTDSARSYIGALDDDALQPPGWTKSPRPAAPSSNVDMAIYELHVRDFSIGDASVAVDHRGRYLAFTDAGSAGMRHLRALQAAGITDIHLLPVFDIASVPEQSCVTPAIPPAPADSAAPQAVITATAARDCFNWGYDPYHFSAPEGSYASNARDAAVRIREFRQMVAELHTAGLRVGMDVVYNHTVASGQKATSVLDRIVPGYYHRLDANGAVTHSTCCENTATEHLMMARLLSDSVLRWARDYSIDSFRFDLMGHQPRAVMEALRDRLKREAGRMIPLIGEGWNFGEVADGARFVQASQASLAGSGIATFSDRARDALRGGGCCDSGAELVNQHGLLNGLAEAAQGRVQTGAEVARVSALTHAGDLARAGLAGTLRDYATTFADGRHATLAALDYKGAPAGYAASPREVVNYVENHDNLTLFDVNALRLPAGTPSSERARVQLLGAAFVLLSQGVPYFHAGFDLLRSKSLDRNSFDSGDAFNRLDWTATDNGFGVGLPRAAESEKDWPLLAPVLRDSSAHATPADIAWMRDAFRDWLRLRAETPALRLRTTAEVQRRLRFENVGAGANAAVIVGHLDSAGVEGAHERELLYLLNVSTVEQSLNLAEEAGKPYVLHPLLATAAATDARARQARCNPARGRFSVPARTAVVFVVP